MVSTFLSRTYFCTDPPAFVSIRSWAKVCDSFNCAAANWKEFEDTDGVECFDDPCTKEQCCKGEQRVSPDTSRHIEHSCLMVQFCGPNRTVSCLETLSSRLKLRTALDPAVTHPFMISFDRGCWSNVCLASCGRHTMLTAPRSGEHMLSKWLDTHDVDGRFARPMLYTKTVEPFRPLCAINCK